MGNEWKGFERITLKRLPTAFIKHDENQTVPAVILSLKNNTSREDVDKLKLKLKSHKISSEEMHSEVHGDFLGLHLASPAKESDG